jgi:hypothetical protein
MDEGDVIDEQQWLHARRRVADMVHFLFGLGIETQRKIAKPKKISKRKLRLYACGSCRLVWHLLDDRLRHAVEVAERLAEGRATKEEVAAVHADIYDLGSGWYTPDAPGVRERTAAAMVVAATEHWPFRVVVDVTGFPVPLAGHSVGQRDGEALLCDLLRCVVGNLFHPSPPLPTAVLAWNDDTVRRIAQGVYDERAFDRLPILADALLDAGCNDEDLIQHCRSDGPHARGCWAVDLILGRQ